MAISPLDLAEQNARRNLYFILAEKASLCQNELIQRREVEGDLAFPSTAVDSQALGGDDD
jgi:hypothetical protein